MKFKKRLAIVLSALLIVLSFSGCADTSDENGGNDEIKTIDSPDGAGVRNA